MAGAPVGNTNARKGMLWRGALTRALAEISQGEGVEAGLRRIAKRVIDDAMDGNYNAIKEIAERMDGKAAQSIMLAGDEDGTPIKHSLVVAYVSADRTPSET